MALRRGYYLLSTAQTDIPLHPAKRKAGIRHLVCYPLIVRNERLGVFYIYHRAESPFPPETLHLLETLAHLAAQALETDRRLAGRLLALEHKVKDLEKLRWAVDLVNTRTSVQAVWREILEIGLDMTAAKYGSFELYDKEKHQLSIADVAGIRKEIMEDIPPLPVNEESITGWVAYHKTSLLITDLLTPPWRSIYTPLPTDQPMRSELAVPLIGSGDVLEGVLNIESPRPNAFGERDKEVLETLATEAVNALQEFRLLETMQEIARATLWTEENELLQLIIDKACQLINVGVGSIWKIEGDMLVLRQTTAGYEWLERISLASSITAQAIKLRRPVSIPDVKTHPHFHNRDLAIRQKWVSGIVVPLLPPDKTQPALGGFSLYASHRRDFTNLDRKVLTYLANQATITLQNAEKVATLKRSSKLSDRENEVLSLLIEGRTNKEIADALFVTVNTVKKHVQNIYTKLNVDSRAAAVAKVLGSD